MPEVIFTGPAGRLEGRYHPAKQKNAPIAMVLHPHPARSSAWRDGNGLRGGLRGR